MPLNYCQFVIGDVFAEVLCWLTDRALTLLCSANCVSPQGSENIPDFFLNLKEK